jgi:N-acetyl-alpha-D-glucosaminyl L-malate synthase BshA
MLARQMLARNGRRLPFVTTLHGTDITLVGADRAYLPITRYAIDESDGVTSISDYLRRKTVETFSTTRPIHVITNFVNCDVYLRDPEASKFVRAQYAEPDEAVLVHLSNFRPVKRIQDVIRIFAGVAKEMPARLLMVGDGPERSSGEWLAKSLNISDRVAFLGKHDQVSQLLPAADLMLMPSELESFGLAALEAMACEVPTIGTNVGGVPELIQDGVTGLLFPVGDVDAMSAAAVGLLKDRDRLREMARAGRQEAQRTYCASRVIPKYEEFYESILRNSGH